MAHVDYRVVAARAGSLQFASTRTVVPVVRTGDHFDRTGRARLPSLLPSALSLESAAKSGRPGTTRRTRASLQGSRHSPQRRGQPHSGGARLRRGSGRPLGRDVVAARAASPIDNDLVPYWICDGPVKVERRVPLLPYSREIARLKWLKKSVAVYRLAFGQPRQDDLLAYLRGLDKTLSTDEMKALQIRLEPPAD